MKRIIIVFLLALSFLQAQQSFRKEIKIPDIPGYVTLRCDFHMHTVFSDGNVWPTIRVDEAWMEGLDVISITDHIEYLPHKGDVDTEFNRPYEIAKSYADKMGIMLIKGTEITKGEPPGHFNALFVKDISQINRENYLDAVSNANKQGAFVFWNHPGWKQPDSRSVWYKEQEKLLKKGLLHGIEIYNWKVYYPNAQKWCLEKKLTIMGNSDIHDPITFNYKVNNGELRPMTLVFAKEKSEESVKEALFARRTSVMADGVLYGEEKYLKPIFINSVEILNPVVDLGQKERVYVQIKNKSDITFELMLNQENQAVSFRGEFILEGGKTAILSIRRKEDTENGKIILKIPAKVKNMIIAPDKELEISLDIKAEFN